MAYIVNVTPTSPGSVTTWTANIGPNQQNDLICILVCHRSTSNPLDISGYTGIDSQRTNDAYKSRWFVKIAGVGGESSPTVTVGGSGSAFAGSIAFVIRDADVSGTAANAIDTGSSGALYVTGATAATCASPTLTTSTNNTLLLHGIVWDSSNMLVDPPTSNVNLLAHCSVSLSAGAWFKGTAGAIDTFTWTANTSTNAGLSWVLPVKNATNGTLPVRLTDGRKYLQLLGGFSTLTTVAPDNNPPNVVTIGSIITNTVANTVTGSLTVSTGQSSTMVWPYSGLQISSNQNITATAWVGCWATVSSTNISGKVLTIPWALGGDTARISTNGLIIAFADASNNWAAFKIIDQYKLAAYMDGVLVIKPGTTTEYATSVTESGSSGVAVDFTAITRVGYFYQRITGSTTAANAFFFSPVYEDSVCKIIGGGSNNPIDTLQEGMFLQGGGTYFKEATAQGAGQLVNRLGIQYGDGSTETYVKHTAQAYGPPGIAETTWQTGASSVPVNIYASASDTKDFSASIFSSDRLQDFTINASSSTSATYNFVGCSIVGYTPTWKTGVTATGITFSQCATVNFKGASPTNITVNDTVASSSEAAISFDANGATLTTSTIDLTGTSAGYHISLGASVTSITLNGNTFTGTPGTDKIYSELASGTLTITWDGVGTSIVAGDVTFVGGSTAVAVISAPTVNQSVTITGFTAGSRIQIYDVTSATELFNGTASAGNTVVSGSTATWTDPAAASSSRAIRVRVAYVSGATAEKFQELTGLTCGTTSGTESVTYPVTPEDDDVYNTNAIDGPAIYATSGITFTDAATDLVNCNIPSNTVTWPTIYACFVYWLSTAAGIDDDVTYIDAPDTANYILTSMKLKNTSSPSVGLSVTGGWGRDASTGLSITLWDSSGGTIGFSADHAVPYSAGSGLTAGQAAELTAIKGKTDSLTFTGSYVQADVQAVNATTVTGSGTEGDPWGP